MTSLTGANVAVEADLELIRHAVDVPRDRQDALLDDIERVMRSSWNLSRRHFSHEDSPFQPGFSIALIHEAGRVVGYSVFRLLELDGARVLYRGGAAVETGAQNRGHYARMTAAMLRVDAEAAPRAKRHLAWRTRNPVIWCANAYLCEAVVPDLTGGDPELLTLCLRLARELYPDHELDSTSMVMRNVYGHMPERARDYARVDPAVAAWFSSALSEPGDAMLALGRLREGVFSEARV